MEFAQGGDLFAYTLGPNSFGKLAEVQARWIFQQLVLGLDYCHRKVCCKLVDGNAEIVSHKLWNCLVERMLMAVNLREGISKIT